jgi:histidyl-tRNA synthetase
MKLQQVRGTKDIFGDDIVKYNYIVDTSKKISKLFNFREIIIPIFEFSEIFERNLGESSDIIMKEIYKFKDRSDNFLSLRPEFTAGIVRAILSNPELRNNFPLKLFSYGPIFRYDRPQKGRQREFNQINFEYFGNNNYMADVNIIQLASKLLGNLNLKNIKLEINSLGSDETRSKFETSLRDYLTKYKNDLSNDSKIRLEKNVLRILDTKDEGDKKILTNSPSIANFYTDDDKKFLNNILNKLSYLNIDFNVNKLLVRGLDYYTSTVFEFVNTGLDTQNTVLGGGRYDKLVREMDGGNVSAVGFAAGIERLMLLLDGNIFKEKRPISIVPIGDSEIDYCINLQKKLFERNVVCELISNDGKVKSKMNIANKINSEFVIIVGEDEIKSEILTVKNMDSADEEKVSVNDLFKLFQ